MDKMFKRSLLGAAIATVAVAGSANAAIELNGQAVQLYGQAAGFMHFSAPAEGDDSASTVIESRVGFRGTVEFDDFGPDFVWQIEGGNADNSDKSGQLGARDTFLGLKFDGVGTFKYGRQLVAAYNYVDWPHSNPGLGNVFDWNNDIGASFGDRVDNNFRFDSETFGVFNFQATLSNMNKSTDQAVFSLGASVQAGPVNIHGGFYTQGEYDAPVEKKCEIDNASESIKCTPADADAKGGDVSYGILGATLGLDALTFTGAVKSMHNGQTDADQVAISATAQYIIDSKLVLKAGIAQTSDAEVKGKTQADTGDTAFNLRVGYLLPSTYLFIDSRNYAMNGADDFDHNILVGAEYYF